MNLSDYRNVYYTASGKASDVARQLAFAGIALIWIFRDAQAAPLAIPPELLIPASLFVLALGFDLSQYVASAVIWGFFSRNHEGKGTQESTELSAPMYANWPALLFFWLKIAFVLLAYWLVFSYIVIQQARV